MGLRIMVVLLMLLDARAILAKEVEATIRGACGTPIRTIATAIPCERLGHRDKHVRKEHLRVQLHGNDGQSVRQRRGGCAL